MKTYTLLLVGVIQSLFVVQSFGQNGAALFTQRKEILRRMEKINADLKACQQVCSDARDAKMKELKPYENDQSYEARQKFWRVNDESQACDERCGTAFRIALEPIRNELIANTNKIQATGARDPTSETVGSRDPDLGGKGITFPDVSDPTQEKPKETKKDSKEVECRKLTEFRNGGMERLYKKTLAEFEINQEAMRDFMKFRKEIESEGKWFSTEAEAAYYVAQIAKTTSNLIRNTLEIHFGSVVKPFNKQVDKLQALLTESDDKVKTSQEVVIDETCELLRKAGGKLSSSAKAACTLINDIQHLSTMKTGIQKSRDLLKGQMSAVTLRLTIYEQNLETEKNNLRNLNEVQAQLNAYLSKNCSK